MPRAADWTFPLFPPVVVFVAGLWVFFLRDGCISQRKWRGCFSLVGKGVLEIVEISVDCVTAFLPLTSLGGF